MELNSTPIQGVYTLSKPVRGDDRGSFCRLYGFDELEQIGLQTKAFHVNTSTSTKKGTLRGIHYQYPPYAETKIVSCLSGAVWDLAVDLRPNSPTQFEWFGIKLTPANGMSLIVPEGCGHAFITLEDNSTVVYVVSAGYSLPHESGAKYDDQKLNISWPIKPTVLSVKDQSWLPLAGRLEELNTNFSGL